MRTFVAGGTGQIGANLVMRLLDRSDAVVLPPRRPDAARAAFGPTVTVVEGDPTQPGPWQDEAAGCDAVINLTGENLFGKRWNDALKKVLVESRVRSTQNVIAALARASRRPDGSPKVLVNASAIGYYGPRGDEELTEDDPPGDDFAARLCVEWEKAAAEGERHGLRVPRVR